MSVALCVCIAPSGREQQHFLPFPRVPQKSARAFLVFLPTVAFYFYIATATDFELRQEGLVTR